MILYNKENKQDENILNLFNFIQSKASNDLAYFFRINFLKIDEIDQDFISIINNTYEKIQSVFIDELKKILFDFNYMGKLYL